MGGGSRRNKGTAGCLSGAPEERLRATGHWVVGHIQLVNGQLTAMKPGGGELDRYAFQGYQPAVEMALARVRSRKQDGNVVASYKVAGEMFASAEDHVVAAKLIGEPVGHFPRGG